MAVDRIERYKVCPILDDLKCDACKHKIETYYIYTLLFPPAMEGNCVILCADCAKELKDTLNKKVDDTI